MVGISLTSSPRLTEGAFYGAASNFVLVLVWFSLCVQVHTKNVLLPLSFVLKAFRTEIEKAQSLSVWSPSP